MIFNIISLVIWSWAFGDAVADSLRRDREWRAARARAREETGK